MLHQDTMLLDLLRPKKQVSLYLQCKQYIRQVELKYPKYFSVKMAFELKNDVTNLLEKHNFQVRRAATKYNGPHKSFAEGFNKELAKLSLQAKDAQELQHPERVLEIWVKYLNNIVKKMNNTKSSMNSVKEKDAIKMDIVKLHKCKTYPPKNLFPEDGFYRYLYQPSD